MIIHKIEYNGGNIGYFIETRKGYLKVNITENEYLQLKEIKSKKAIKVNSITGAIEEEEQLSSYLG